MHPISRLPGHRRRQAFRVPLRVAAVTGGALLLSACMTLSPDGGMAPVAQFADEQLGKDVVAVRSDADADRTQRAVRERLKRPLGADAAVQVALLNNRGLQAAFNELGIAEAVALASSLPPNPGFSVERLSGPVEIEIEKRIVANILALATLPVRAEVARDRFRQAKLRAIEETLRLAADTRRSFHRVVALRETAAFLAQANEAAKTATQLARRLGETGALNKLDQAREQVFYAEVATKLARARQAEASERERLTRLMGLWGGDAGFRLPAALPRLPKRPKVLPAVEVEAVRRRVDLQVARIDVEALAKTKGLTQATRFINLLEVSGIGKTVKEKATGERVRDRGFEIEFQIPIFDFGEARVREAVETYMKAVNRLTEKAVNARSEARDAYRVYRSSYDIAAHYEREVLPLRKIISDETLLRYNAMQIDVFALLAEARQRVAATVAAIDARRDFWLAAVNLNVAVVGGGVASGAATTTAMAPAAGGGDAGH
jgi:outer membrane protein TolC